MVQTQTQTFHVNKALEQSLRSLPHFGTLTITDRSSVDGDHGPKLWCGMANGKLQVFDASTWMLEQPCLQAKDRIVR